MGKQKAVFQEFAFLVRSPIKRDSATRFYTSEVSLIKSRILLFLCKAVHEIFFLFLFPGISMQNGMPRSRQRKKKRENETKMRQLHELPYTEMVKSGDYSVGLASGYFVNRFCR